MVGAPALSARGALRAGAGLATIAVPLPVRDVVAGFLPEAMTAGLPSDREGNLAEGALEPLLGLVERADAVVLGPGLGRTPGTQAAVRAFVRACPKPLVLDADGLHAFRGRLRELAARAAPLVVTPHEGEATALLDSPEARGFEGGGAEGRAGAPGGKPEAREMRAARIARAAEAVCVLKGPATIVCDGARVRENGTGGPVLATGGTGDVLSGVVAALLVALAAAKVDAFGAASLAVHVHGAAGDRLAARRGDRGVLASEVADEIPLVLRARARARKRR
jgi:NAD(P)H-hydrate epimerase